MEQKTCPGCGLEKELGQFNYKERKTGKRQIRCRACTRLQVKLHYENHHAYYIRKALKRNRVVKELHRTKLLAYLSAHSCVDCGESDVVCLEFDHVRGHKVKPVSQMIGAYEWAAIEKEIAKCQVRCANCHRRRTAKQRGYYKLFN
jgi:hypothetical protein